MYVYATDISSNPLFWSYINDSKEDALAGLHTVEAVDVFCFAFEAPPEISFTFVLPDEDITGIEVEVNCYALSDTTYFESVTLTVDGVTSSNKVTSISYFDIGNSEIFYFGSSVDKWGFPSLRNKTVTLKFKLNGVNPDISSVDFYFDVLRMQLAIGSPPAASRPGGTTYWATKWGEICE